MPSAASPEAIPQVDAANKHANPEASLSRRNTFQKMLDIERKNKVRLLISRLQIYQIHHELGPFADASSSF